MNCLHSHYQSTEFTIIWYGPRRLVCLTLDLSSLPSSPLQCRSSSAIFLSGAVLHVATPFKQVDRHTSRRDGCYRVVLIHKMVHFHGPISAIAADASPKRLEPPVSVTFVVVLTILVYLFSVRAKIHTLDCPRAPQGERTSPPLRKVCAGPRSRAPSTNYFRRVWRPRSRKRQNAPCCGWRRVLQFELGCFRAINKRPRVPDCTAVTPFHALDQTTRADDA